MRLSFSKAFFAPVATAYMIYFGVNSNSGEKVSQLNTLKTQS